MFGRRRGAILFLALFVLAGSLGASTPAHAGVDEAIPLVEELIAAIDEVGLPHRIERSLIRKLEGVLRSLERGHERVALLQLRAFGFLVHLLTGRGLSEELAEAALESANVIKIAIAPGPPPVLENLLVGFGSWDPVTDLAGDFVFVAAEDKVFLEFGAVVDSPEGPKTLPTFEYRLSPDADVVSPLDGSVDAIEYKSDTDDYEIRLISSPTSPFVVSVDHVTELEVAEGDVVAAGQPLGKPGTWSPSLGRTELQVFNFVERRNYCPLAFADPALAPALEADVTDLMDDWETFKGDATLYDQGLMTSPGCLEDSLPE